MCLTFLRKPKELCQVDVLQLFELSGWIFDWGGRHLERQIHQPKKVSVLTREELLLPLILSRLTSINRLKSAIRSPKMILSNCSLLISCTPSATACSVSALSATSFHFLIIDFVGSLKQEYMREAILSLASMKSRQLLRIRLKSSSLNLTSPSAAIMCAIS